jgi:hypothetical protein
MPVRAAGVQSERTMMFGRKINHSVFDEDREPEGDR